MESKVWSDLLDANLILFLDRLPFKSWVLFFSFFLYFYSVQGCIKLIKTVCKDFLYRVAKHFK